MNLYKKESGLYRKLYSRIWRLYYIIYIYAFCSLTDELTEKLFLEYMLINKMNLLNKKKPISYIAAEKTLFWAKNLHNRCS